MMILNVLCLTVFTYGLPNGASQYDLTLLYDGYLPFLGGFEQKAKVDISLSVEPKGAGEATTSLRTLSAYLSNLETGEWVALPFNEQSAKDLFPTSTIKFDPSGRISATSMPKTELPVRLPGLDLQHIPDITFMLLELPAEPVEVGDTWSYSRRFGDSTVFYDAKYDGEDETGHRFRLTLRQDYETKEDENNNPTLEAKDVAQIVRTKVTGDGTVWFKGPKGWIVRAEVNAEAVSSVYNVKPGDPVGQRRLRTLFKIEHKGSKSL